MWKDVYQKLNTLSAVPHALVRNDDLTCFAYDSGVAYLCTAHVLFVALTLLFVPRKTYSHTINWKNIQIIIYILHMYDSLEEQKKEKTFFYFLYPFSVHFMYGAV